MWRRASSFSRANRSGRWVTVRSRLRQRSRLARPSPFSMLSSEKTGPRSIRALGGPSGIGKGSRMMRKVSLVLAGAALGAASAAIAVKTDVFSSSPARAAASDTYRDLNLFGDVFEKIRTDYVEKPDEEKLVEAAINGMLTSLDPHSSYMDAKSYRDMQVQTRGEFGGLGIEVTQENGDIKVVTPIDDTPASKAGILSGDLIVGDRRRGGLRPDPEPGGRQDARRGRHGRHAEDRASRQQGPLHRQGRQGLQADARRHHHQVGEVRREGRHRLHPHQPVQRADVRRPQGGHAEVHAGYPGRQVQGIHHGPAQQSGRPARPVDRGVERLHRPRRDRLDARPQRRRDPALQRPARRRPVAMASRSWC